MSLPLSPVHNREFLSNHWLEHRLPLEPEYQEHRAAAVDSLRRLLDLWRVENTRVGLYGDEAGLEEKFIQPVFESLGWHLKYQTYLNRREPDYALFLTDDTLHAALNAGRTSPDFWQHAAAVADAKAWHISLDRPTREGANREYPPEQIEWYLNHSLRDYGILTNGRLWRLVPRVLGPTKPRFQTYVEVDLPSLLASLVPASGQLELGPSGRGFDDFLGFYLLFSPVGFASFNGRKPLLDRAVAGSSEYSLGVGEELKDRVFEALRLCVEGFIKHTPNGLDPARDLRDCQEHSFIFLYRLLFIMYAEDRGLLPYRINQTYTKNRALARHRDDVAARLDQVDRGFRAVDFSHEKADLWADLQDLFDLIDRGHRSYGVQAYNGGLFDQETDSFLSKKVLSDWYLARVLDQLGRASQAGHLGLFRVDYRDLAIQQLGTVYEGLLELRPRYTRQLMRVIRAKGAGSREELVISAADRIPQGYEATAITYPADGIYLATDKGERRRSGSYYTPDHIVDYIVQKTVGARCTEVFRQLHAEIAAKKEALAVATAEKQATLQAELDQLKGSFDDRVLQLKILDPAMGSGHFLIRACQLIAEEIATNPFTSDHGPDDLKGGEPTITYWKRRVAESCLHGVDLNPMAVELAKLALWLETVAAHAPLTFLDHHFRCGDSIVGARIARLDSLPGDEGLFAGQFRQEVTTALPTLLDLLKEISVIPSDTVEHVKQKEKIYTGKFLPALKRFALVGDLWSSEAMQDSTIRSDQYAEVLKLLKAPRKFDEAIASDWAQATLRLLKTKEVSPFHWELAYPHIFLSPRNDDRAGFDIVLGNPPYDVLSEREIGQNIDHLKRFIDLDATLQASKVGKNNLYKIFVLRCLELLAEGGYLSFIVPMPLLGDEQASAIRRKLLSAGEFRETHSFPQKDNPTRRVFRDAKLSTALFVFQKLKPDLRTDGRFRSQVHSAQFIEADSPSLTLNSNSIKLYDPENLTIVSCSQEDWDVVTSLAEQPIARLRDYVDFYQGEVNQTIATAKGFLTDHKHGPLITRGANICLYQLRGASQGEDIYLDVNAFLKGKDENTKAFHHRMERVGLQESSPQNNFRRIIACRIAKGNFCNHTINYTTKVDCEIDLALAMFVLNSSFADWYFRLGSTNAHVSHYQLTNLPCPRFGQQAGNLDKAHCKQLDTLMKHGDFDAIEKKCLSLAATEGCSPTVEHVIATLVKFIEREEHRRGEIARTERSHLAEAAERCQVVLDKLMLDLLGLGNGKHEYIRQRLKEML
jgi:type I restriction-modification system DNA methylase subunit